MIRDARRLRFRFSPITYGRGNGDDPPAQRSAPNIPAVRHPAVPAAISRLAGQLAAQHAANSAAQPQPMPAAVEACRIAEAQPVMLPAFLRRGNGYAHYMGRGQRDNDELIASHDRTNHTYTDLELLSMLRRMSDVYVVEPMEFRDTVKNIIKPPKSGPGSQKLHFYLLNSDKQSGPGIHWLCVIYDPRSGRWLWFNSFGGKIWQSLIRVFGQNFIKTDRSIQATNSELCGLFCVAFGVLVADYYRAHHKLPGVREYKYIIDDVFNQSDRYSNNDFIRQLIRDRLKFKV